MKKSNNRYLYRNNQKIDLEELVLPDTVALTIEQLDLIFPAFNPTLEMTETEIRFRSGQRSVVEWLIQLKAQQEIKL